MSISIDILCAVGTNAAEYAEYFKKTAEALSTTGSQFNWKSMLAIDKDTSSRDPQGFINCGTIINKQKQGSLSHTQAMNRLLSYADADITVVADIDIAILKKGWDEDLLLYLEKYDCFGIGWGKWDRKYLGFPSIMFIAFPTILLTELTWDLSPEINENGSPKRYSASVEDSKICNVPVGTVLKKDSGWKIPYFFKNKTGFAIDKYKVGNKKAQLPFKNEKQRKYCLQKPTHMSEYILNGELWASHLQASRSKPFDGENASTWRWRCNTFIKNKYGIEIK